MSEDPEHAGPSTPPLEDAASAFEPRALDRVVVGLADGASARAVTAALVAAGVSQVREPFTGALVGVATVDDDLLARLQRVPGVRYVEREVLHGI